MVIAKESIELAACSDLHHKFNGPNDVYGLSSYDANGQLAMETANLLLHALRYFTTPNGAAVGSSINDDNETVRWSYCQPVVCIKRIALLREYE